jgi:hypothetical protein
MGSSNHNPLELCLPNSQDYGHESSYNVWIYRTSVINFNKSLVLDFFKKKVKTHAILGLK